MKLTKFNTASVFLIFLVVLFIVGKIFSVPVLSNYAWMSVFPVFSYLYYGQAKQRNHFFGFFLLSFSIAEILNVVFKESTFLAYYCSNFLIIAAYSSLIIFLIKDINLKLLIKEFKLHLIILAVFNSYLIYALNQMIMQDETIIINTIDFAMEVVYNVLILLVLSLSLVHYLYHETKQGLLLFLASVCIVFSEMVQVAYIFISSEQVLQIIYSLLMGIGFYFLYVYIKIKYLAIQKQTRFV
ncbi:hypothetical protein [Olleya aquimaris]|uniref:Uncharacterized protein n=1 Tax=Olleya aquimaris TaxID=639310 RepID=A0A327RJD8_9FLAO|nr:hypothetical protein [Olleya aquimaris]RAJ17110.1 hypothetical protein LY08_00889 [Olleya aquimaris]